MSTSRYSKWRWSQTRLITLFTSTHRLQWSWVKRVKRRLCCSKRDAARIAFDVRRCALSVSTLKCAWRVFLHCTGLANMTSLRRTTLRPSRMFRGTSATRHIDIPSSPHCASHHCWTTCREKAPRIAMASKCVHKGCGKTFTDPEEPCHYHPG